MTLEELDLEDETLTVSQLKDHFTEEGYKTRIARVDYTEGRIAYYLEGSGPLGGMDLQITDTEQMAENREMAEEGDFRYPYDDLEVSGIETYEKFGLAMLP